MDLRRSLVAVVVIPAVLLVAAPSLAAAATVTPAAVSWTTPARVLSGDPDDLSVAVDSNGNVHIAATRDGNLYYVTDRSGSWTHRLVLPTTSKSKYRDPSIALDQSGRVHIAVERLRKDSFDIDQGIWYVSDVGRDAGTFPSTATRIAPKGNGDPVIQASHGHLWLVDINDWNCQCDGTIQLRTNASGAWTVASIGPAYGGDRPSFRLGPADRAQVAWDRHSVAGIDYARASSTTGGFSSLRIPGSGGHDFDANLAVDSHGNPWVAWSRFTPSSFTDGVVIAHVNAGTWSTPDTAISGLENSDPPYPSFDIDSAGRPNIVIGDNGVAALLLARGTWRTATVASHASPFELVMRRSPAGGMVAAWTDSNGGLWVSRRTT